MKKTLSRIVILSSVGLLLMGAGTCHPVGLYENYFLNGLAKQGYVQRTVKLGPDTVTYWDNGSAKPTLLLAHGFGGGGTWSWTKQLNTLGQHYRVISPDFLWFHNSHSEEKDFSLEHQARMLVALLDHLKIEKTHILGTSYGGLVSYMLAMKSPERLDRIIFAASPGPDYGEQDYLDMCERLKIKHMGELLLVESPEDLKFLMDSIYLLHYICCISRLEIERGACMQKSRYVSYTSGQLTGKLRFRCLPHHPHLYTQTRRQGSMRSRDHSAVGAYHWQGT